MGHYILACEGKGAVTLIAAWNRKVWAGSVMGIQVTECNLALTITARHLESQPMHHNMLSDGGKEVELTLRWGHSFM